MAFAGRKPGRPAYGDPADESPAKRTSVKAPSILTLRRRVLYSAFQPLGLGVRARALQVARQRELELWFPKKRYDQRGRTLSTSRCSPMPMPRKHGLKKTILKALRLNTTTKNGLTEWHKKDRDSTTP